MGAWLPIPVHTLFLKCDSQAELLVLALTIFSGCAAWRGLTHSTHGIFQYAFALNVGGVCGGLRWVVANFLVSFLGVSAFHFFGDPVVHTPPSFRAMNGVPLSVSLHWMAFPWLFAT